MVTYHHFYIECRSAEGWCVPPDFEAEDWTFEDDRPKGGFAWVHPHWGWLDLFWGSDALFPMRSGPPPDRRGSVLLEDLEKVHGYDFEKNEDGVCWIPYQELFIDTWDTDLVTVCGKIPAQFALAFGDGQQPFPEAALVDAGLSDDELYYLTRGGRWTNSPIDISSGKSRFELEQLPPAREVKVTWRETIAESFGDLYGRLFKGLRQYGRDEDLRILSRRG